MMRSLYAAVSGLRNHQTRMDVIGNNIANSNTIGFKAGRVTFKESLTQLIQGASRPPQGAAGTTGGTNATGYREAMEICAFPGKAINIGGFHIRMTMATQVSPAPVIRKDEQDVGLCCGLKRKRLCP